ALWYGGVMGAILGLAGFTSYQMVAHAHWTAVNQELQSIAGTLHDSLEAKLTQPGQIEASVQDILPNLCLGDHPCTHSSERHILNAFGQSGYYIRLLTHQGKIVATAGDIPMNYLPDLRHQPKQILQDKQGIRYQRYTLALKNVSGQPWGWMEIGRSLQEFDDHLAILRWIIWGGFPVAILLVGAASWFLAGLAMQPIVNSYEKMQQFTADAAHEIRTPLASIQAVIESTFDTPLSEREFRELFTAIARQNQRLVRLTEDLLLISRLERHPRKSVEHPSVCLNDLLTDVVEGLLVLDMARSIRLSTNLPNQPIYVKGEPNQLAQIFTNLLTNALQYTPENGQVSVLLNRTFDQAVIDIQDTGIGIDSREQERIFDRFYRVASDRSRCTGGVGLGLAIAREIVTSHRGSIQVSSTPGQGSIFAVRLPVVEVNNGDG
ncbi:two-component sensor histidine kinase, partial [Gloeomargarita lithophora Alchichica-D10]